MNIITIMKEVRGLKVDEQDQTTSTKSKCSGIELMYAGTLQTWFQLKVQMIQVLSPVLMMVYMCVSNRGKDWIWTEHCRIEESRRLQSSTQWVILQNNIGIIIGSSAVQCSHYRWNLSCSVSSLMVCFRSISCVVMLPLFLWVSSEHDKPAQWAEDAEETDLHHRRPRDDLRWLTLLVTVNMTLQICRSLNTIFWL